jgi:hypothetical protein
MTCRKRIKTLSNYEVTVITRGVFFIEGTSRDDAEAQALEAASSGESPDDILDISPEEAVLVPSRRYSFWELLMRFLCPENCRRPGGRCGVFRPDNGEPNEEERGA